MPRVIHFEIPADDPQRAVKFYREAFGWEISTWGGPGEYWLATTGPDTTQVTRAGAQTVPGTQTHPNR